MSTPSAADVLGGDVPVRPRHHAGRVAATRPDPAGVDESKLAGWRHLGRSPVTPGLGTSLVSGVPIARRPATDLSSGSCRRGFCTADRRMLVVARRFIVVISALVTAFGVITFGVVVVHRPLAQARQTVRAPQLPSGRVPVEPVSQSTSVPPGTSDVPPGMVGVIDQLGRRRGFIARSQWDDQPELLSLGTGAVPVRGYEVVDVNGKLTGYMFSPGGFVDLAVAAAPETVDLLVKNPTSVVDSAGELVSGKDWNARLRAGTARLR